MLGALLAAILPSNDYMVMADGATYIGIADHYAEGRWSEAVNTYWSPFLSWLLAGPMAAGVDPMVAFRVVQAGAALGALALVRALLALFGTAELPSAAATAVAIPLLAYAAGSVMTPDLLLCVALLGYVRLAVDRRLTTSPRWALATGAAGGAAYLVKSIALPVVVAHLGLVLVLRLLRAPGARARRGVVAGGLLALLAVGVVAAPWIAAISARHGSPTISTAASLNVRWSLPGSAGSQQYQRGLLAPPTPNALSLWEDPTVRGAAPDGGGLDDLGPLELARGLLTNVGGNLLPSSGTGAMRLVLAFCLVGLLGACALVAFRLRRQTETLLGLGAAGIHGGALLATYVHGRYVLAPLLLLLVLAAHLLGGPVRSVRMRAPQWALVVAVGVLAAVPFTPRIAELVTTGRSYVDIGRSAAPVLDGAAVASDAFPDEATVICAFAGCSWHGFPAPQPDPADLARQLAAVGIDYYLAFTPGVSLRPAGAVPVDGLGDGRVTVYSLPPPATP